MKYYAVMADGCCCVCSRSHGVNDGMILARRYAENSGHSRLCFVIDPLKK